MEKATTARRARFEAEMRRSTGATNLAKWCDEHGLGRQTVYDYFNGSDTNISTVATIGGGVVWPKGARVAVAGFYLSLPHGVD